MNKSNSCHCWDITKCQDKNDCPAYSCPEIACWEIAKELNDYRRLYKVCEDCIVYLSKQENSILSAQEIESILAHKGLCVLNPKKQKQEEQQHYTQRKNLHIGTVSVSSFDRI